MGDSFQEPNAFKVPRARFPPNRWPNAAVCHGEFNVLERRVARKKVEGLKDETDLLIAQRRKPVLIRPLMEMPSSV